MCGPKDPLFTPLLQFARVPFQAKESVHKTPFWENLEILASASIFAKILALKPRGLKPGGGGTDLERGYGDVRPWSPPFHASPAARKGPISSKRVSSQDPLLRKFGNFSLNSLNFHPNFSSQAPKFGNFQLTSPQIWKFSAHKPPFSEANVSSQPPHFGNPGRTPLPEKKLSAPPPRAPNLKIFSSQAPKLGNFQFTNPPFSETSISSQASHFGNPGHTPLPEKKLSAPPPGTCLNELSRRVLRLRVL